MDSRIVCLIGSGDSTKSTILKAIEWVFWPTWNLAANDTDFYHENTKDPIIIRCTFSDFPDKLLAEDKFGLYLRKPYISFDKTSDDEPCDTLPLCLTMQLTVDSSLEPKWEIISNRQESKIIAYGDRKLIAVGAIGENCSRDMVWGKYSILQKYADAKGVLHEAYTSALRDVAEKADLSKLDVVASNLKDVGKKYGVNFNAEIKNKLLIQNGSFSSSVGVFDGEDPLSQFGTGSQRLISMGLNVNAADGNVLLLIDEIENGLEPYRLRSLINEFRSDRNANRQIIMTTHSPVAIAECTVDELLVIHSKDGVTEAFPLNNDDDEAKAVVQAQVRSNPEALLCKRIIVCEGKTEIGFIRALDNYLSREKKYRMAFRGIGTADGGGSKIFRCAKLLHLCGYNICVLMDSDIEAEDPDKKDLGSSGISVFDWDKPNAFEEQIFLDASVEVAHDILKIAIEDRGIISVKDTLENNGVRCEHNNDEIAIPSMTPEVQKKIGSIAKKKHVEWYKRVDLGEMVGNVVFDNWAKLPEETKTKKVVTELIRWVMEDD